MAEEPDYLVNQSSKTCLSVVRGSRPNDAIVAMAKISTNTRNQWFFCNGQWQWGGNRKFCLDVDPSGNRPVLRETARSSTRWVYDASERLSTGSVVLDVPWEAPRTKVIMYPCHDDLNQKWWTLSGLKASLGGVRLEGLPPRVLEICHKADHPPPQQESGQGGECGQKGSAVIFPEYLISQSTNTCLTVLQGSSAEDAVIGLADYDGSVRQQWLVRGGQWLWAGNRSLCLCPDEGRQDLCLADTRSGWNSWTIDEEGVFGMETLALDVPWEEPRTKVILFPVHGDENQKWWTICMISMLMQTSQGKGRLSDAALQIHGIEDKKRRSTNVVDGGNDSQCHCCYRGSSKAPHSSTDGSDSPDYLISQSTNTCLTVLNGSTAEDAVIGLADYEGSVRQQWLVRGGQWLWAGNRSLCLSPDARRQGLCLADSKSRWVSWSIDEKGVFGTESLALDVPWEEPRTKVILYPAHGGVNQKWWVLSTIRAAAKCVKYPLPCSDVHTYKQEMTRILVNKMSDVSRPLPNPVDVDTFPGRVASTTPRCSRTFRLDLRVLGQARNLRMTAPEDWQPTDVYVPAGDVIHIILPETLSEERAAQITALVGAQRDSLDLSSPNVVTQKQFRRSPEVSEEFELAPGVNTLRSQFGGNLIFTFDEGDNFETTVEVHNVVRAPFFTLGQTSDAQWEQLKQLDAPYSILESKKVVVVAPTKAARKLSDPTTLLRRYDEIIGYLESLSGFGPNDPPPRGRQWLVDDVQISAGSAHAGFPAMFYHQHYDLTSLSTPYDWVSWHELGHNYQQGEWWSYAYGVESTVNLFSCYIEEQLGAGNRLKQENQYEDAARAVEEGLTFDEADCWQKLIFLMEIRNAFPDPGWEMFRTLIRSVRALSEDEAQHLAADTQRQLDYVYKVLSRAVGADLILHYQRWGISISEEARREIQSQGLGKVVINS